MDKDFDHWNKEKKRLEKGNFTDYVKTREVWWCAVGVSLGVESSGKEPKFERPILVLRKFSRHAVLAVPLTSVLGVVQNDRPPLSRRPRRPHGH